MRALVFLVSALSLASSSSAQSRLFDGEQIHVGTGTASLNFDSAGATGFWLGDVDANGTSDIVTLRMIQLRDAQGGLGTPLPFALGNFGLVLSAGVTDVNGDGRSDLVYAHDGLPPNYESQLIVRISDGLGGFTTTSNYALPWNGYPASIGTGDLTLDGKPEIFVANWFAGVVSVFVNNGTGSFAPAVNVGPAIQGRQFFVADLTGDSLPDLLVYTSSQIRILPGNGAGGFGTPITITVPFGATGSPGSARVADVNEDGKPDLVGNYVDGTLAVRLGDGLGGFGAPSLTTLVPYAQDVRVGDFDLDGHLDAICTIPTGGAIVTVRGDGLGGFGTPHVYRVGGIALCADLADMDLDGDLDFVAATGPSQMTILEGDGLGGFHSSSPPDQGPMGGAYDVSISDFDADGFKDAAFVTPTNLRWLRGDGAGGFSTSTVVYTGQYIALTGAGDFDADGKQDLALVQFGGLPSAPCWLRALRNNGTGGFALTSTLTIGTSPSTLIVSDIDLDGRADALVSSLSPAILHVAHGAASGGFGAVTTYPLGAASSTSFAVGDIDTDGWPDVVIPSGANLIVMRGNGTGGLAPATSLTLGGGSNVRVWLVDMDADTRLDLVTSTSTTTLALRSGNGAGGFGSPTVMSTGAAFTALAPGDVNTDGIGDLCFAMASSSLVVLPGLGAGQFGTARWFGAGANPLGIALVDLNHDGRTDVVTVNDGTASNNHLNPLGSMSVLLNHAGEPEAPRPFCFGRGGSTACPCGNTGGVGRGCANTGSALGARLVGSGAARISADTFVLACSDYPSGAGVYFRGSNSTTVGMPFGAGLLCAGGALARLGVAPAAAGVSVQGSTYPALPPNDLALSIAAAALPGSVHAYQFLFREPSPGLCTVGKVNLSNAIEAVWVP